MKIAVDVSQLVYGTGVSSYLKNLVTNLLAIDKKNHYILFAGSLRSQSRLVSFFNQLVNTDNFQAKINFLSPNLANFLWNQLHILPIEAITGPVDVLLSSDWTQPPTLRARTLTVVYDLIPWLYPETLSKKIINVHKKRMAWVKKEVSQIIAISKNTKEDLGRIIGIAEEKITVAYPGLDINRFFPQNKVKVAQVKKKYHLDNYILGLGTQEPRKNFKQVIAAFEKLNHHSLDLAIVGKYGWGEKINIKNKRIKTLGYVCDNDLASLYSGASALVYPSLYEGFGLPIIEAQACGCPVITSKTSSMPEAAGKGAILVNPKSTKEIFQSIKTVLVDLNIKKELIERGKQNIKRFSWLKTAQTVLGTIENL